MGYERMFELAQSIIQQKKQNREFVRPDDTVCVLMTKAGNLYAGVNYKSMQRGIIFNSHAEIQAVQNMLSAGENALEAVLLMSLQNSQAFLPCMQCIGYMMSLNEENPECQIVLGKDTLTLAEVYQPVSSAYSQNMQYMQNQPMMMR